MAAAGGETATCPQSWQLLWLKEGLLMGLAGPLVTRYILTSGNATPSCVFLLVLERMSCIGAPGFIKGLYAAD